VVGAPRSRMHRARLVCFQLGGLCYWILADVGCSGRDYEAYLQNVVGLASRTDNAGFRRFRTYNRLPPPLPPVSENDVPFVTILRPIKGYDPNLDLCLASTCLQNYPRSKFEVVFCVATPQDAAVPVINHVLEQHPDVNAKLQIGEEGIGPNPKIRNLSKAYREATGDIVWILDCNIWVNPGTLRRSVELLEGKQSQTGYKLVHHLPIAVDVSDVRSYSTDRSMRTPSTESSGLLLRRNPVVPGTEKSWLAGALAYGGGRLEENFLSSSHAKIYCAINTLAVASCVVGKSEMFRRSHLAEVTRDGGDKNGLSYFSDYICEDHMISEKLFLTPLDEEVSGKRKWRRHGMGTDLVFQPLEDMTVGDYLARRMRWIRVRKYANLPATFVESLTESVTCSLIGSYAVTTVPSLVSRAGSSWMTFWGFWTASMAAWGLLDRVLFNFLHAHKSVAVDDNTPEFIMQHSGRTMAEWMLQWIGREAFAFPVWLSALWPGPISWRGGLYRIRWRDMKVEELGMDGM